MTLTAEAPTNQFSPAFSVAFDPPSADGVVAFVITGTNLTVPGYRLALVQPGGELVIVTSVTRRTPARLECTWAFTAPGTYYFVLVNTGGLVVSDRLPVTVTRT